MRKKLLSLKSHQEWSWVFIVTFFLLSIINVYFGLLGIICISMPLYHAFRGYGKVHCSHYCPRGSFFGNFLAKISLNNTLPKFMRKNWFKNLLLILMFSMFIIAVVHSKGNIKKISFSIFRLMFSSFVVGTIMGIFAKPRAWCQVCPMGHGTDLLKKLKNKHNKKEVKEDAKNR